MTGSIGIMFLDYSAKSKIFNLPKHIQLLRCGPLARASATARQGRTAAPAIRWSVASGHEGHGSGVRWVAPPAIRAARAAVEAGGSRGRPGSLRFALGAVGAEVVETRRLELLTPSLQRRCSTS